MKNITKHIHHRGTDNKCSHFIDNIPDAVRGVDYVAKKGKGGYTEIHERHLKHFLEWLHPATKLAIMRGMPAQDVWDNIDNIIKGV